MRLAPLLMMKLIAFVALALAACAHDAKPAAFCCGRELGESTRSPGADSSRPEPVTSDDPSVMNVSASITPQMQARATEAPAPQVRENPTASTPVTPPTPIAPPSMNQQPQPNVNSPPPPPATSTSTP